MTTIQLSTSDKVMHYRVVSAPLTVIPLANTPSDVSIWFQVKLMLQNFHAPPQQQNDKKEKKKKAIPVSQFALCQEFL